MATLVVRLWGLSVVGRSLRFVLLRERLVRAAVAAAAAGVREVGGNNHGPEVKKFLAAVGLPEGYAWCDAFVSYLLTEAAGRPTGIESAGVIVTYARARAKGWVVSAPARGDIVCFDFDSDGSVDDHIGIVVKVLRRGPWLTLRTVEGNTSSGLAGSQADGGGVYLRTRVVRASSVRFIRVPGEAPPVAKPYEPVVYIPPRATSQSAIGKAVSRAGWDPRNPSKKPKPEPSKPRAKTKTKPRPKAKPAPTSGRRYYTRKSAVKLKRGEMIGFHPGKGYYARPKPKRVRRAGGGRPPKAV